MLYLFKDDLERLVSVPERPERIVSLCPSVTETLIALGLKDRLAGRTRYCVHPSAEVGDIPEVGGTRGIDASRMKDLAPDLIIAVKDENDREEVEGMRSVAPVFTFDIRSFGDALSMILRLGRILGKRQEAMEMVNEIEGHYARLPDLSCSLRYLYLVWRDPWMAASKDTYVDSVLACTGFINCIAASQPTYPALSDEDIVKSRAELVILPSEPYPFRDIHKEEIKRLLPRAIIEYADGEMMSWFGARMLKAGPYLRSWIGNLCSVLTA